MERKKNWKTILTKQTKEIGTYDPSFDVAIEILASILDKRDMALKQWKAEGSIPVVELSNRSTATHPCLKLAMECESSALAYLKEMGLTASGYKRIKGDTKEEPKECVLEELKSRFKVG